MANEQRVGSMEQEQPDGWVEDSERPERLPCGCRHQLRGLLPRSGPAPLALTALGVRLALLLYCFIPRRKRKQGFAYGV